MTFDLFHTTYGKSNEFFIMKYEFPSAKAFFLICHLTFFVNLKIWPLKLDPASWRHIWGQMSKKCYSPISPLVLKNFDRSHNIFMKNLIFLLCDLWPPPKEGGTSLVDLAPYPDFILYAQRTIPPKITLLSLKRTIPGFFGINSPTKTRCVQIFRANGLLVCL